MSSDPLAPPVLRLTLTRDPLADAGDCPAAPGWHSETHVLSGAAPSIWLATAWNG